MANSPELPSLSVPWIKTDKDDPFPTLTVPWSTSRGNPPGTLATGVAEAAETVTAAAGAAREKVSVAADKLHAAVTPHAAEAPSPLQPAWLEAGKGPSASNLAAGAVHAAAAPARAAGPSAADPCPSSTPNWLKADAPVPTMPSTGANTPRGRSRAFTTDSRKGRRLSHPSYRKRPLL